MNTNELEPVTVVVMDANSQGPIPYLTLDEDRDVPARELARAVGLDPLPNQLVAVVRQDIYASSALASVTAYKHVAKDSPDLATFLAAIA